MTHIETAAENYRQSFRGPGNHVSSMDIKKSFKDGYNYALNKVYKYIEEHIFDFPWYDNEQGDFSSKDIANALRKAMEE